MLDYARTGPSRQARAVPSDRRPLPVENPAREGQPADAYRFTGPSCISAVLTCAMTSPSQAECKFDDQTPTCNIVSIEARAKVCHVVT
jgi:hypothetical protein